MKTFEIDFLTGKYTGHYITDSLQITEVFYKDLKPADNSCSFSTPYSVELYNKLMTVGTENLVVRLKNDAETVFYGYLRKNYSHQKTTRNKAIKIEITSPSFLLNVKTKKTMTFFDRTVDYIVKALLIESGFAFYSDFTISNSLPCVKIATDTNIKDTISTLLYEYGYTFDFDTTGKFNIYPLFETEKENKTIINGTNTYDTITIEKAEEKYSGVSITWDKIEKIENHLVFSDTQNATNSNKCEITIDPKSYLFDTEENYLEYDSTRGEIIATQTITGDLKYEYGIEIRKIENFGDKAVLSAYNTSTLPKKITKLDVIGTAYVSTAKNTTKAGSFDTEEKTTNYESKFIQDKDQSELLAKKLKEYYQYSDISLSFKAKENFYLGEIVQLVEPSLGTINAKILQKKTSSLTMIEYKAESINEFELASANTVISIPSTEKEETVQYLHIMYSNLPSPTLPEQINNITGDYIGQYTDTNIVASADPAKYKWSRIKGETGPSGIARTITSLNTAGYNGEVAVYNSQLYEYNNTKWQLLDKSGYLGKMNSYPEKAAVGSYFLASEDFIEKNYLLVNPGKVLALTSGPFGVSKKYLSGFLYEFTESGWKVIIDTSDFRYVIALYDLGSIGKIPDSFNDIVTNVTIENIPIYTPHYLGSFSTVPVTANNGDWFFYSGVTTENYTLGKTYKYNGNEWIEDNDFNHVISTLNDALTIITSGIELGTVPIVSFLNILYANQIIAKQIATKELVLTGTGQIRSENYTSGSSGSGFSLNSNGFFECVDGIFRGSIEAGPLTFSKAPTGIFGVHYSPGEKVYVVAEKLLREGLINDITYNFNIKYGGNSFNEISIRKYVSNKNEYDHNWSRRGDGNRYTWFVQRVIDTTYTCTIKINSLLISGSKTTREIISSVNKGITRKDYGGGLCDEIIFSGDKLEKQLDVAINSSSYTFTIKNLPITTTPAMIKGTVYNSNGFLKVY